MSVGMGISVSNGYDMGRYEYRHGYRYGYSHGSMRIMGRYGCVGISIWV